ncbi:LuxR C-terminal-related transcriptional regulator [Streptomyces sp. NPDC058683]|uniref:LuxR C-terminal-related transcriptional regulator n=1 Tax=Streptomyces sp. NPDC058683 TaxID=3346597 RepID=UPI00364DFF6F
MSLAHDASSMSLGFGPICARRGKGMVITQRGSKRSLIHSHSMRSQSNPRMLSIRAARPVGDVGLPLRKALIRMLVSGHPDKQIAKRLGLSMRSTAEHVASLKSDLGAKNRTEMGYLLAGRELANGLVRPSAAASA